MSCCPDRLLPWLLLAACSGAAPSADSGPGDPQASPLAFDAAVLDPPFENGNAVWAGVALLDYDGDGWTDIFFTNGHPQPDALYRNNGDGSFTDVAAEAGLASTGNSGAVVAGDLDNDGDPDLVINQECTTGTYTYDGEPLLDGGKLVMLNDGHGSFSPLELVLDGEPWDPLEEFKDPRLRCTTSLALADLDRDGFLDLISTNAHDPDVAPPWAFDKYHPGGEEIVLYGDGTGNFPRVGENLGHWGAFVSSQVDLDGDGLLDVVVGQSGQDLKVWRGQEDGSLVLDPDGAAVGAGLWMGLAAADYDGDGDVDLYGTNQGLSPLMLGYDNLAAVWPGSAEPVPDFADPTGADAELDLQGVNPFHAVLENQDGRLYPTSWPLQAEQLLAGDLFSGLDGRYLEWVAPQGLERLAWAWGAVPLDVDADGWIDVAFTGNNCTAPMCIAWEEAQGAGPGGLLRNLQGQGFEDITWQAGVANVDDQGRYVDGRGLAVGDLNRDGYADLVVANRSYNPSHTSGVDQQPGVPRVWLSRPRQGGWLQLRLRGTTSNRDAIGSTVLVSAGGRTWRHAYGAGGSTNSSSERLLILGLGEAEAVQVEVTFPSGQRVDLGTVQADQDLLVEEEG